MTSHTRPPEDVPLNRWGFIPPWAPLLIMAAVVFTGVVLGEVGSVILLLFLFSGIVCTALVELRGLFLTVVALPIYWFLGIGLIGYITDGNARSGGSRKTAMLTAAYPAVENYLWLVATFMLSLLIAITRQRLDAAARERAQRLAQQRRRAFAAADEDNRRVTSRVRSLERTGSKTASPGPRTVARPRPTVPSNTEEVHTRTAAELRAASERRRLRSESSLSARHRSPDSPLDFS